MLNDHQIARVPAGLAFKSDPCQPNPCLNGGHCIQLRFSRHRCECIGTNFYGDRCQKGKLTHECFKFLEGTIPGNFILCFHIANIVDKSDRSTSWATATCGTRLFLMWKAHPEFRQSYVIISEYDNNSEIPTIRVRISLKPTVLAHLKWRAMLSYFLKIWCYISSKKITIRFLDWKFSRFLLARSSLYVILLPQIKYNKEVV